jgi:16S rRNA (guanine966-N2)-methyltransferase
MRVVAGDARGRRLVAPPGQDTRPTLDRVREAVFNTLQSHDAVEGARVLDLFAGSGALGIEALSRGAEHCVFVERSAPARRVVQQNLDATGLGDRAAVVGGDALRWVAQHTGTAVVADPYDLVLLDPPYAVDDPTWATLLTQVGRLAPDGVIVIESDRAVVVPDGWHVLKQKRYGDTLVCIASPTNPPSEPS